MYVCHVRYLNSDGWHSYINKFGAIVMITLSECGIVSYIIPIGMLGTSEFMLKSTDILCFHDPQAAVLTVTHTARYLFVVAILSNNSAQFMEKHNLMLEGDPFHEDIIEKTARDLDSPWSIDFNDVVVQGVLGSGGFAQVKQGLWNFTPVCHAY